jgi:hypothetical protein
MSGDGSIPMIWPDTGLRPHPFAAMFRMLVGEEKEGLATNVVEKGLFEKIKVYEEQILDGRNRYMVLVDEGVFDPEIETWRERPELFEAFEGTREEALDYAWSLNAERRHDNASQKAMAAERYANLRNVTQAEAAAKFGVSERQVNSAAKVIEQGQPELVQAVEEGRLPLYIAEQVADLDEDDQREVAVKPKREAAAAAKQKLQDPPPLAESGPVVKALDPARFVIFAEAMTRVAERIGQVPVSTVRLLSMACGIAGDPEGVTLSPAARLAVDLANRKSGDWSMWGPQPFLRSDLQLIEAGAGMPDDIEALTTLYRQLLVAYDAAMLAEDGKADALSTQLAAVIFRANGDTTTGQSVDDRPITIQNGTRAPDGEVPLWGQRGRFIVLVDGVKAMVQFGRDLSLFAVDFNTPFVSASGSWSVHHLSRELGSTVSQHAEAAVRVAIAAANGKDREPHERGLAYPSRVFHFGDETEYGSPPGTDRGAELTAGAWPALVAVDELEANTVAGRWEAEDRAYPKPRKREFPKSRHGATKIFAITRRGPDQDGMMLVPLADFPATGAYLVRSWGGWRFVDDAADPDQGHVARRLTAVTENDVGKGDADEDDPAVSPEDFTAAYTAALAAAAGLKGKHSRATAEPILRAGVAAFVTRAQMAEDLGHPIGTILTWTHKLKLTGLGEGRSAPRPRGHAE